MSKITDDALQRRAEVISEKISALPDDIGGREVSYCMIAREGMAIARLAWCLALASRRDQVRGADS